MVFGKLTTMMSSIGMHKRDGLDLAGYEFEKWKIIETGRAYSSRILPGSGRQQSVTENWLNWKAKSRSLPAGP
jgi:hypothetical protein